MQGSYKNNGLPRPYYMKPNKRGSAYENASRLVFLTNSRKLMGYVVMLVLFGLCMFMVAQEIKPKPDALYEIMNAVEVKEAKNNGDVGNLVDSDKKDKNFEQPQVANNKAQNSRGEYGHGVMEAPKGGMVNEGPVVGADEGLLVDGKTKKAAPEVEVKVADEPAPVPVARGNGVKASRESEKKAAAEQNPDLRKLNEQNSNTKFAKAKDIVAPRMGDADVVDPDEKVVDAQTKEEVDNRMHKKVDAMGKLGEKESIKKEANADESNKRRVAKDEEPVNKKKDETVSEKKVDEAVSKKNDVEAVPKKKELEPIKKRVEEVAPKKAEDSTSKKAEVAAPKKKDIPFDEKDIDAAVKKRQKTNNAGEEVLEAVTV